MYESKYQSTLLLLAGNIKAIRSTLGISQEELALRSGVDRTFISKIERSLANPSVKTISDIAVALNTSLPDLLNSTERE